MAVPELVDDLYEAFADALGGALPDHARSLPWALGLAPSRGAPWSAAFADEVTLAAPALLAEAMSVAPGAMRDAVLAHLLAVIDAYGTERLERGSIAALPGTLAVLGRARRERERAIERVCSGVRGHTVDFGRADRAMRDAVSAERAILEAAQPADVATYERVSLAKREGSLVAAVALAYAAGWDARRRASVRVTLASIWLGLGIHDAAVDWESDLSQGGSWVVCLMKGGMPTHGCAGPNESLPAQVLESGVLHCMLARAHHYMHAAGLRAAALGMKGLHAWALARGQRFEALAAAELTSAGYAARAHALSAWATDVLA